MPPFDTRTAALSVLESAMPEVMQKAFTAVAPLSKAMYEVLPNGNLHIRVCTADDTLDETNEVTEPEGFKGSLDYIAKCGSVNWDHGKDPTYPGPHSVFGKWRSAELGVNPKNGRPALLGDAELYKGHPLTQVVKRIIDDGGDIFASIQGQVLQRVKGHRNGKPIVRNVRCRATSFALTNAPTNPSCGLIPLAKSMSLECAPQDRALGDRWLARSLTVGDGIVGEGATGGAALRSQSMDRKVKKLCPQCGGNVLEKDMLCEKCGAVLKPMAKAGGPQLSFFPDMAPGEPEPQAAGKGAMLPDPGNHYKMLQLVFGQSPEARTAAHDAWHQKWQGQGGLWRTSTTGSTKSPSSTTKLASAVTTAQLRFTASICPTSRSFTPTSGLSRAA
jgi:hypothetical protein